ncbi:MAG: class I tRNA ligase family protein, partial [Bacteroidales bacterium]|nr:class I tRNA ligase family protein [Bacteroidales bacterium]
VNRVGYSERTKVAIEPRPSLQWFLKMEALAPPALEVVLNHTVRFHPAKFKNTYKHWMENVRDWCISRQLWWGHRIPAYYLPTGEIVVARSKEEALQQAKVKFPGKEVRPEDLHQDEDVLDTWFSSWLWPISVFDGIRYPGNPDIRYYYPTNDLITAPEILFFWVARMIMAGLEYRKQVPFHNVYLTGIVRDEQGRKMSKSLGNSPDPIELMDKYGADGTRVGMLLTSPAGNDLPFDEVLCEQGRNFSNKIWNALRLIRGWQVDPSLRQSPANKMAVTWFESRFHQALNQLDDLYQKYRISEALMLVYKLIWDDFCSWYLEMIKPEYEKSIDAVTFEATVQLFEKQMQILHPFMPFITEEIWHRLRDRAEDDCIMVSRLPVRKRINRKLLQRFDYERDVIIALRSIRKEKKIPQKEALELFVKKNFGEEPNTAFDPIICKLCNLTDIAYVGEKPANTLTFIIRSTEFYIPFSSSAIDTEAEVLKLEEELAYQRGFLEAVERKLSNERFEQSAPVAVVEKERRKKADAEARIKVIEEQVAALRNG